MNYNEYKDARNMAWQILIDCHVMALPVKISEVCRKLGVMVHYYTPKDSNDGQSTILDGTPMILVSLQVSVERQRFTCAHELGHIILGHVGKYKLVNREPAPGDNPIESAANVFASRLLAPACVLWGCRARSPDEIMALCHISRAAAEFRAQRMDELYKRDRFLVAPMEREVYRQFEVFIHSKQL